MSGSFVDSLDEMKDNDDIYREDLPETGGEPWEDGLSTKREHPKLRIVARKKR